MADEWLITRHALGAALTALSVHATGTAGLHRGFVAHPDQVAGEILARIDAMEASDPCGAAPFAMPPCVLPKGHDGDHTPDREDEPEPPDGHNCCDEHNVTTDLLAIVRIRDALADIECQPDSMASVAEVLEFIARTHGYRLQRFGS